jgi:hypothetical protein
MTVVKKLLDKIAYRWCKLLEPYVLSGFMQRQCDRATDNTFRAIIAITLALPVTPTVLWLCWRNRDHWLPGGDRPKIRRVEGQVDWKREGF